MTPPSPSAPALRAAAIIVRNQDDQITYGSTDACAREIDSATGLPELIAAIYALLRKGVWDIDHTSSNVDRTALNNLRAALSRVEGQQPVSGQAANESQPAPTRTSGQEA